MFNKKKYFAIITIRQLESHNVIGSIRIRPTTKHISFKGHTFLLDIETPSYVKGNKIYYFFSISSRQQLTFYKIDEPLINPEVIDLIMTQKIVQQLASNLDNEWKMNSMVLIVGLIIGCLIGYIVGQYLVIQ